MFRNGQHLIQPNGALVDPVNQRWPLTQTSTPTHGCHQPLRCRRLRRMCHRSRQEASLLIGALTSWAFGAVLLEVLRGKGFSVCHDIIPPCSDSAT